MEINRVFLIILTIIIATVIEITVITAVIFGMLTICYIRTV